MNWIDIFCLTFIVLFFCLGLWSGLIKSLFHIAAWGSGAVVAYFAYDWFGRLIHANIRVEETTLKIFCLILGFVIPFLFLLFLGRIITYWIKSTSLSTVNRFLGGLLGIVKAVILCLLLLTLLHLLPLSGDLRKMRNEAIAYDYYCSLLKLADYESDADKLHDSIVDKVKNTAQKATDNAFKKAEQGAVEAKENVVESVSEKAQHLEKKSKEKLSQIPEKVFPENKKDSASKPPKEKKRATKKATAETKLK